MKLTEVREEHAYFTTETGTRCRAISYGGIAAVWAMKDSGSKFSVLLLFSLICFSVFLFLDMLLAFACAVKAERLIRHHEVKVHNLTNALPGPDYSFDRDPNENTLSKQGFWLRPIFAALGCLPLIADLLLRLCSA